MLKLKNSKTWLYFALTLVMAVAMLLGTATSVYADDTSEVITSEISDESEIEVEEGMSEDMPEAVQEETPEPATPEVLFAASSGELITYVKTLSGIHFELSTGHSENEHWRKSIAGTTAYCLQPGIKIGDFYDPSPISDDLYIRMSLADYWGRYVYGDSSETNFYVQLYVWETLGHQVVSLSGPTVSLSAYHAWKSDIEGAINAFFTLPSFAGETLTLRAGENVSLTDHNGSLPYYSLLAESVGMQHSQSGNTLQISTNKHCNDGQLRFIYDVDVSFQHPMYYWSDGKGGQDIFTAGIADPVSFTMSMQFRRFRVEVQKEDTQTAAQQGDASLAGAVYGFYDIDWNLLDTYTTNSAGCFTTDYYLVVVGEPYYIKEISPSPGYQLDDTVYTINTDAEAMPNLLNTLKRTVLEDVIRGGVRVEKWDNEINARLPQGSATLAGAVFEIYNRSGAPVWVDGELYRVGEIVATITTDEDGVAQTSADLLPFGTYEIIESEPPEGYLSTGVLAQTFSIREHGVIVDLNTSATAIKNNPIRGDLQGVKVSQGDAQRLAGVPFSITSATTGESHIIVTDANGQFNTASSWNPHSQYTNRGETDRDGIWFGDIATLDDSLGALLYDTYIIEELPCAANAAYTLLPPFEVKVYRDSVTVDLGTLINEYAETPWIGTTAMDSVSLGNVAEVSEQTTIIDKVEYSGLMVWREYTLEGIIMDRETGTPLLIDGKPVTASLTFTPEASSGFVEVEFTFNSLSLVGKSITVFEVLYDNETGEEIASHADIKDDKQTVRFIDTPPEVTPPPEETTPPKPGRSVPQTGDKASLLLWVCLAGMGATGIGTLLVLRRRKKKQLPNK